MPKAKLKDLIGEDDLPPARQVSVFVNKFVHGGRDLERAACLANLDPKLGKKLYLVPKVRQSIDRQIAKLKLESMGVQLDKLTAEQEHYLTSWDEGT